jgi:hypothetical protein
VLGTVGNITALAKIIQPHGRSESLTITCSKTGWYKLSEIEAASIFRVNTVIYILETQDSIFLPKYV